MSCRGPNLGISGALRSKIMAEDAPYFRVFCGERDNRRLGGGEGWIRTPGPRETLGA